MLEFVEVGNHGRGFRVRVAACAVIASTWVAPLLPQAPPELRDLLPELAAKIAALVAPDSQVSLTGATLDSGSDAARQLEEDVSVLLASRGVRVVATAAFTPSARLSCSENLRERSCLAEVQRDARRDVVMVTRVHDGTTPVEARLPLSLVLQPLIALRSQILDVVNLGERLLVLDATSVSLYQRMGQGWQPSLSRPLPASGARPRDLRGRLRVQGDRIAVFLPGVTCSGSLNQLTLECADGRQPWPLGIENNGIDPARNFFSTPEGLSFYSAAALGAGAGARWLVADLGGALSLLDDSRRMVARVGASGDVAVIATSCGPESYVIAAELSEGRDTMRLFQVAAQRLLPIGSPVFVPGRLTALWSEPGAMAATAVAHDVSGGRHEAFLATISCSH